MESEFLSFFESMWKDLIKLLPKLIISAIVLILFIFLSGKIEKLIKYRLSYKTEDAILSGFFGKISKWVFLIIGFVLVMEILGFASLAGGIITGAGLSAVILGFAFKNIGENFFSGLLLAFKRPFKVGDTIHTEGYTGTVSSMDFRTTNIKTLDGQDIFIPNSMIINNPLSNFTYESKRRFDFTIQFDYENDIDKAKNIINSAVQKVSEVLADPIPIVVVDQLTTSISIKTYYWLDAKAVERSILLIKSEVIEKTRQDLNNAGINITDVTQIKIMNDNIPVVVNSKN